MKISKAPVLLKKAVTMCKSKTGVLASRLLLLASFRRRMATAGVISHKIHALIVATGQAKARRDNYFYKVENMPAIHASEIVDISHQLALLDQEERCARGCPDWTLHPIFNHEDNCCYIEQCEEDDDEASVIDMIRSTCGVERLELNMDDDIDQAAEMFIRRFREQMNNSF